MHRGQAGASGTTHNPSRDPVHARENDPEGKMERGTQALPNLFTEEDDTDDRIWREARAKGGISRLPRPIRETSATLKVCATTEIDARSRMNGLRFVARWRNDAAVPPPPSTPLHTHQAGDMFRLRRCGAESLPRRLITTRRSGGAGIAPAARNAEVREAVCERRFVCERREAVCERREAVCERAVYVSWMRGIHMLVAMNMMMKALAMGTTETASAATTCRRAISP